MKRLLFVLTQQWRCRRRKGRTYLDAQKISSSRIHCLVTMVIGANISYLEISQRPRRASRLANTYVDTCFEVATSGLLLVISGSKSMTARST